MQFAHGFQGAAELQAESTRWRVTPKYTGPATCWGSMTHPLFIAETMVPNLEYHPADAHARASSNRALLEDNAFVLMEYNNGARRFTA